MHVESAKTVSKDSTMHSIGLALVLGTAVLHNPTVHVRTVTQLVLICSCRGLDGPCQAGSIRGQQVKKPL